MDPNFRPRKYPKMDDMDRDFARFKKRIIIGIIFILVLAVLGTCYIFKFFSPYIKVEKQYLQPADTVITIRNGQADTIGTVITIEK